MNITQMDIKINQTNQQNGGKTNSSSVLGASGSSFDQVLAMFNILGQTLGSEKQSAVLSNPKVTNQVGNNYSEPLNNIQGKDLLNSGKELTEFDELGGKENNEIPIDSEKDLVKTDINRLIESANQNNDIRELTEEEIGKMDIVINSIVSLMQQLADSFVVHNENASESPKIYQRPLEQQPLTIQGFTDLPLVYERPIEQLASRIQNATDTPGAYQRHVELQPLTIQSLTDSPLKYERLVEQLAPMIQNATDTPRAYQRPVEQPLSTIQNVSSTSLVYERPVEQLAPMIQNATGTPRAYQRPVEQPLSIKNNSDSPKIVQRLDNENIAKSIRKVTEIIGQFMEETSAISPQKTNQILQQINNLLGEVKGKQSFESVQKFEGNIRIILNELESIKQSNTTGHSNIIERGLIPETKQSIQLDKNQVLVPSIPQQVNIEKNRNSHVSTSQKLEDIQKNNDQTIMLNAQSKLTENDLKIEGPINKLEVPEFTKEVSEWISRFIKITDGKSGSTEAKFSLFPEHLGHIEIKVTTQQGQISAQILTDTPMAKDALEGQLQHLKQALQQSGLHVQKLDVAQQTSITTDSSQSVLAFSQDGSQSSREQRSYTASQNNRKKQNELTEQKDRAGETLPITYGGIALNSTSRIDFTA